MPGKNGFSRRVPTAEVGVELAFEGKGEAEKAYVKACNHPDYQLEIGKLIAAVDPEYFRPTEVELLIGDPAKAKQKLNWQPKYDLKGLVEDMVKADIEQFRRDQYLKDAGHKVLNHFE